MAVSERLGSGLWTWQKKWKKKHTTEWKAHNKIQRQRKAQCEWHWKGQGQIQSSQKKKGFPRDTEPDRQGARKNEKTKKKAREKDDELEQESPTLFLLRPEPGFEMFAQGASFAFFHPLWNPTVGLLQEHFNHKARRHARNGWPSLTECRSPSRSLSEELQANSRPPGPGPAGWRPAIKDDRLWTSDKGKKKTEHCV